MPVERSRVRLHLGGRNVATARPPRKVLMRTLTGTGFPWQGIEISDGPLRCLRQSRRCCVPSGRPGEVNYQAQHQRCRAASSSRRTHCESRPRRRSFTILELETGVLLVLRRDPQTGRIAQGLAGPARVACVFGSRYRWTPRWRSVVQLCMSPTPGQNVMP